MPAAHESHPVFCAFVWLPFAHVAHEPSLVPIAFSPYKAVQFLQVAAPATVPKPAWHFVHVKEPFTPCVLSPFGHTVHMVLGSASMSARPAMQAAQALAPLGAYVPAAQGMHERRPVDGAAEPAAHDVHVEALFPAEYLPAGQRGQLVAPAPAACCPGTHTAHCVAELLSVSAVPGEHTAQASAPGGA